jgi:glucose/arabinose dehydrogenase
VLDPDFTDNGHLYLQATVPGDGMTTGDRSQVLRFTDVDSIGTNQTLVVDGLPVSPPGGINNGGELAFRADGTLLVSIGDTQVPELAQEPGSVSLAGRVLRYDLSQLPAVVPGDNPVAGDPTYAKGLRNVFGMAIQPVTGGLFAADNGPAANDRLFYLAPGRNGGWGAAVPVPGAEAALTVRLYPNVIVPTAACWHDGTGMPAGYANNLFLASYDDQALRRFVLSGAAFTDIDEEIPFATLTTAANAHKVLDVEVAPDGSLYLATFTGIYRIFAID